MSKQRTITSPDIFYIIFLLSGLCALAYQIAWVRIFSLEFGSTALAISTIVGVFMGGLAIGATMAARSRKVLSRPLLVYAIIELTISAYAFSSTHLFPWALTEALSLVTSYNDHIHTISLTRFSLACALILPPTILMGMTLPLVTQWCSNHFGKGLFHGSSLYAWNTFGATIGAFAMGLALLPWLGLTSAVSAIALLNGILGLICLFIYLYIPQNPKRLTSSTSANMPSYCRSGATGSPQGQVSNAVCPSFAISIGIAAASTMICQVIWSRVIELIVGPSVYTASIVLGPFLAGLALGAAAASKYLKSNPTHARALYTTLLLAAALAITGTTHLFSALPGWYIAGFHSLENQQTIGIILPLVLSGAVLLIPTLLFGGTFPAALCAFSPKAHEPGASVGRIFTVDVVGSILGVVAAGFLLLPILGVISSVGIAAMLLVVAALLAYPLYDLSKRRARQAVIAFAVLMASWLVLPQWEKQLMTSGPHTYASHYEGLVTRDSLREFIKDEEDLIFYADGVTATITVAQDTRNADHPFLYLSTNGKIDGSSHFDMPTQRLAAHIPMMLHPNPTDIGIIGMGTGVTAGSAALYPDARVDVIEVEKQVINASKLFTEHNNNVHALPNVNVGLTDGRLHLLTQRDAYDVVISIPSNPWVAGSADLFTADFFQRASNAIKDDGIFVQWVQLYGMSPDTLRMVIKGFSGAFDDVLLATTIPHTDILVIGANHTISIDPWMMESRIAEDRIRADISDSRLGIETVPQLLARLRMDDDAISRLLSEYQGPLHTDDRPVLAYRAPFELHENTRRDNAIAIKEHATGIAHKLPQQWFASNRDKLADAYRAFLGPTAREAKATETHH